MDDNLLACFNSSRLSYRKLEISYSTKMVILLHQIQLPILSSQCVQISLISTHKKVLKNPNVPIHGLTPVPWL
jgi:hypothetical protein